MSLEQAQKVMIFINNFPMLNNIMEEYKNWKKIKINLKRRQRRKETTTGFIKNLIKGSEVDMTEHYDNKTHDS